MRDVTVAGNSYRIQDMDAFSQLDLSMDVAPIVPVLLPILQDLELENLDMDTAAEHLVPLTKQLSDSKEQVQNIVKSSLGSVQREQNGSYYPVMRDGNLMYSDMQLPDMMQLTWHVILDQLGPFMGGLVDGASPAQDKGSE